MVILAVPSNGNGGLSETMNPRFGRCPSFTFITLEKKEIKAVKTVPNSALSAMGGAGVQAAQLIGMNNATVLVVGMLGPNAAQALNALNIKILQVTNPGLTVKQVIDLYLKGELTEIKEANVGPHYGMDSGVGSGQGMRRGFGGQRGRDF